MGSDQKSAKILGEGSFKSSTSSNSPLQGAFRRLLFFWVRVGKTLGRDGLLVFLWELLVRCTAPFASLALLSLYERDLNEALPEISPLAEITVTVASESDIELIAAQIAADFEGGLDALPAVLSKVQFRLRLGQICFVAKIRSAMVHDTWIAFGSCPVQDRRILLKDHEAYLAWAYTLDAWRGKHIYPAVDSQVLRFLQKAGYRQALTLVKTENKSSRTGLQRVGWRQIGSLLTLKLHWRPRTWIWCLSGRGQTERFPIDRPPISERHSYE